MKSTTQKTLGSLLFLTVISMSNISCANDNDATDPKSATETGPVVADPSAIATDPIAHGEEAHKNHCYKCHTDDIYTRDNRFVKSIDALSQQVVRCKEGSNVPWFDEDADAVVQFLNKKYYKF
ncbi:MAG: cytochrome c [Gammaproteobacteria bacterium]|nr:cytochrome c [Gammaproteobacteria bacterium]